ncbi:MAG: sulfurtransferase [Candidatus Hydrogenedentes bacterium]|nr:sulfurtransferase [Candidatus Hydrogenedentota bacterium]
MLAYACLSLLLAASQAASSILLGTAALDGQENPILVDARPKAAYEAGHLPGALNLDPDGLSEERDGVQNMLRPAKALQAEVQALGLRPDKTLVIYSDMAAPDDTKRATRLFWALEYLGFPHVALLDGGFAKWTAEGRSTATGSAPAPVAGSTTFELEARPELLTNYEQVVTNIQTSQGCLLDLRSAEEYAGLTKKPFLNQAGHISGASNVEATSLVEKQELNGKVFYTFAKAESLKPSLLEAVGDWNKPVITYCNSGRDATVGYFGLRMEGHENVSVYDGSMAEWDHKQAPAVKE